jgi:osmotically-inducible protein OsmY
MDHRWDEMLQQEHRRRIEQGRYGTRPIESDADVDRRDQLEAARRRVNKSPWEIGASHWDQRDLYTRDSRVSSEGYGRGPSYHPEEGSYAYHRNAPPPPSLRTRRPGEQPSLYEREAWPWLQYERVQARDEASGLWGKVKHEASVVLGKLTGHPHEHKGPKGWWRADDTIREDVCEALAYADELDASDIEVEVKDAEVWLNGTVKSRSQKRLAEYLTEHVRGVQDVHNRLTVRKDDDDMAFTSPVPAF